MLLLECPFTVLWTSNLDKTAGIECLLCVVSSPFWMSGQEVEVQEMLSWVGLSGTHSKIFNKYLFMENIDGSPKRIILLCTDHYVFFNSDFCALVFVPAVTTP